MTLITAVIGLVLGATVSERNSQWLFVYVPRQLQRTLHFVTFRTHMTI